MVTIIDPGKSRGGNCPYLPPLRTPLVVIILNINMFDDCTRLCVKILLVMFLCPFDTEREKC